MRRSGRLLTKLVSSRLRHSDRQSSDSARMNTEASALIRALRAGASQPVRSSWSDRIGAAAQVATVLLLTFGYFYTIRPVYQKEVLAEEVARLKDEKSALRLTLESAKAEQERSVSQLEAARVELMGLRNELAILSQARAELESGLSDASQRLAAAKAELISAQAKVHSSRKTLQSSARRIYSDALIASTLSSTKSDFMLLVEDSDYVWEESDFELQRPSPTEPLRTLIAELRQGGISDMIGDEAADAESARLLEKLRSFKESGHCKAPPEDTWRVIRAELATVSDEASRAALFGCERRYQIEKRIEERRIQFGIETSQARLAQLKAMRSEKEHCPKDAFLAGERAARSYFEEHLSSYVMQCREETNTALSFLLSD